MPLEVAVNMFARRIGKSATEAAWNRWNEIRLQNNNKTLIRRLIPVPRWDDPSPYMAFRPREKEEKKRLRSRVNDSKALSRMRQLRDEFERARMLLELVKKREKLKRERVSMISDVFEAQLAQNGGVLKAPRHRARVHTFLKSQLARNAFSDSDESGDEQQTLLQLCTRPIEEPLEFPQFRGDMLHLGSGAMPFRARARVARGGRIVFDRMVPTVDELDDRFTRTPIDIEAFSSLRDEPRTLAFYSSTQPLERIKRQRVAE